MLGDQIREAREARGWTQADLAKRLRVGKKTISNWEGNHVRPKNRLGMLRDLLGIEVEPGEERPETLAEFSDLALLHELTSRAIRRRDGCGAGVD